jgi:hypothetical protein
MLDEAKMRRLAMIRYLYTLSLDQAKLPEPLYMVALLQFDDAVELFLALASEHLGAGKVGRELLAYWEAINQKLPGSNLGHKDEMNRLHVARNNWKHHSIRISHIELQDFHINVTNFFQNNTPIVFSIPFDAISMTMLVEDKSVREHIEVSEKFHQEGNIKEAIKEIAIAFDHQFNLFEGEIFSKNSIHYRGISRDLFSNIDRHVPKELKRFAQDIDEEFKRLKKQIKLLSLGIDYRRYIRFMYLTPPVHLMAGDGYPYHISGDGFATSSQDYLFCYTYTVECALRLQEFLAQDVQK